MKEIIAGVVRAHHALASAGQADMVWGHVAVRDPEGRGVWMKAAGWGFEEIEAQRVLLVSWDGEVLAGDGKRHIEYPIHTGIMAARSDVDCTIHTHAMAATAFASLEVPLRAINHDGVPFADPDVPRFTRTGALIRTDELGAALAETLGDARGCLIPQHGLVVAGPDVAHAVMYAVLLDRACRAQLTAIAAGGPKRWSDAEEITTKMAECWPPSQIEAGWNYLTRLRS
ncbi:class II aldolase/adducin family protein [Actinocrispum sp. NPDC049592]|uniref:class II aldolase/adducin family protein n=1 Tax=Actinocrispum sp. NPDC049592 TaxID=3154835 RepID=UPI00344727D0